MPLSLKYVLCDVIIIWFAYLWICQLTQVVLENKAVKRESVGLSNQVQRKQFYTSNIMKGNQEFPGLQIYKRITELSQICKNLQVEFTNGLT